MGEIENMKYRLESVRIDVARAPLDEVKQRLTEVNPHSIATILDQAEAAVLDMRKNYNDLDLKGRETRSAIVTGIEKFRDIVAETKNINEVGLLDALDAEAAGERLTGSAERFPQTLKKVCAPEGDPQYWLGLAQQGLHTARAALEMAAHSSGQCIQETDDLIEQRTVFVEQINVLDNRL